MQLEAGKPVGGQCLLAVLTASSAELFFMLLLRWRKDNVDERNDEDDASNSLSTPEHS